MHKDREIKTPQTIKLSGKLLQKGERHLKIENVLGNDRPEQVLFQHSKSSLL